MGPDRAAGNKPGVPLLVLVMKQHCQLLDHCLRNAPRCKARCAAAARRSRERVIARQARAHARPGAIRIWRKSARPKPHWRGGSRDVAACVGAWFRRKARLYRQIVRTPALNRDRRERWSVFSIAAQGSGRLQSLDSSEFPAEYFRPSGGTCWRRQAKLHPQSGRRPSEWNYNPIRAGTPCGKVLSEHDTRNAYADYPDVRFNVILHVPNDHVGDFGDCIQYVGVHPVRLYSVPSSAYAYTACEQAAHRSE